MYLGVNSLQFCSESIPMGIMLHGGICLPVTLGIPPAVVSQLIQPEDQPEEGAVEVPPYF